ncbi:translocation/assembly module TamB domain-containing protein [Allosphingosinicella indica]|uniref:Autotransporter secretion inner membrane protein TamB n=1 Tax=Allosphingosinicella indica TaxID=941907 RepID=A0A1X7G0R1_9SPHN|nr:translocation/assembly module TamB domain-containing protein [Allosphingosinicella indica]SMF61846.1 autotransporter secretion inner membrane protein TamB [Allosphingosinicella indica]
MDEAVEAPPRPRARRRYARVGASFVAKTVVAIAAGVLILIAAAMALLDTAPGHRFIADRIAALTPESGLDIRIGRIEGSIWGETKLRDVRLYDPQGLFLESPLVTLDWQPLAFLTNRLLIDRAEADLLTVHRAPQLRPSAEPKPLLPDFDIYIGRLEVRQLRLGKAFGGRERIGSLAGEADVRKGRARLKVEAAMQDGGDRLSVSLDAEPGRNRFDLDARLVSPADGALGAMIGTRRPFDLVVQGDGTWARWGGTARLDVSGRRSADFQLEAREGRYRLTGYAAPAPFFTGKVARLTTPRILLSGTATLADRRLDTRWSLRSSALKLEGKGVVDLSTSSFDGVAIGADLLQPPALFPNMSGRAVRLALLLNGSFGSANFAYRLTAPRVAFDDTGFEDVRAEGRGKWGKLPVTVPLRLTARRVTGVGDVAGGILANLRVEGALRVDANQLRGDGLSLSSDKLKGKLALLVDLKTGAYSVIVSGGLTRYLIPGLGIVDVTSELKVVPGAGGRGTLVTGTGRAWVRRFDNRFLAGLAGGLPQIETGLMRGQDLVLYFRNLRLTAPDIRIAGNGYRRRDGSFLFEGSGTQRTYGPFAMTLDGPIDRPTIALRLDRPNDAMGLEDVRLDLNPTAEGYAYRAAGRSTLGPFTSNGAILLPRDAPATIEVAALDVAGTSAKGTLRSDPGGFSGRLDVSGGGLDGRLLFSPVGERQRIEAHLTATNARFPGPPAIAIRRGQLDGVILLDPAGTSIEGKVTARGLSRGPLSIANLEAEASLRGGAGQVRASISGTRGRDFSFRGVADLTPDRARITGSGTLDRRPLELASPAEIAWVEGGWRLSPTSFRYAGGDARVSGLFTDAQTQLDARLEAMPLGVLDIAWPDLGLGGVASGTLNYRQSSEGSPEGAVNLRVRGLTRSGLVLSSRPVDVGVAARLNGGSAAMRAVAVSEGRTIGRAQARLAPVGGTGDLADQLQRAPLFAQLRYNGPADTLWRLTGLDLLDLSGPIAVGADARGTLADPQIRGSIRTEKARLESAVTGTVIENISASGRFGGSRLVIDSFTGTTKREGRVSGRGAFDLSAARGVGMDLAFQADRAQLIDRDDIKAQVTGPITIKSDGSGGAIGGQLDLVTGSFKLGSATAAAEVPRLPVRELNRPADEGAAPAPAAPWRLALDVNARNRLTVTGLGINSEWGAKLAIGGMINEPSIRGQADLVRGTFDFAGRRFDLERGTIRFRGETPVNPELDIVAEGGIQGLNATIRVTGRGQRPEIAFASTPALPQDELLSRLLFGTSITNLSAPEALQLAAAVASLNESGPSLDPINVVRSATGLDRLRILPADVVTGQGTSIAAGKYIGRRVYVEVITDGRGYSATQVEYQITRWLSILSSISTIGRESVNVRVSKDY